MKTKHLLLVLFSGTSLLPPALLGNAPLNSIDHAGIIQRLDDRALKAGGKIYETLCTNCHGADGITPQLPDARAFTSGELKFGKDPYSMFLTLTNGNGAMGPQTWMTPEERYQVIHYIRETFMRSKRDDFEEINDGYLEALPTVNVAVKKSDTIERDFGPALASQLGRETSSALTIKINSDTTISYDLHSMDQAGLWTGGFLNLQATQHYRERGGGLAEPGGKNLTGLQLWKWGHDGTLDYPKDRLPPRGPMPEDWMRYRGHHLYGDDLVLSYSIDNREILESPGSIPGMPGIVHHFEINPGKELLLAVGNLAGASPALSGKLSMEARQFKLSKQGEVALLGTNRVNHFYFVAAATLGDTKDIQWHLDSKDRLVLRIPADSKKKQFKLYRVADTGEEKLLSFANYLRSETLKQKKPNRSLSQSLTGGPLRWPVVLESTGTTGEQKHGYALDNLALPPDNTGNPYNVWFRTSALAFFPDGRMVVSTHGGDIWIVSGVDSALKKLRWKRFAAGLYEPFGLQVIDGLIYVTCKDRLTRLHDRNNDGEADFYESFSADDDVSVNFHAFNFDLQRDQEGNLYYAKSGQYTDYKLPGSIIKVSPDGKKREVYATGLRTPNGMGMMPDGRPTVSDNQGNWMPASKINICHSGGFYGYVQTFATKAWAPDGGNIDHTRVIAPETFDQPVVWMPQNFDNSSGGQLWVDDKRWGPLSGHLLHTSFGKGWLYYLMLQEVDGISQAAIIKLDLDAPTGIHRARVNPKDGQVYAVGLNGWNGNGRKGLSQGGISRFRYTGSPSKLLTKVQVLKNGIKLEFNFPLESESAVDPSRYNLKQWNYLWSSRYGSKQHSPKNDWEVGADQVVIKGVTLSNDRKSVVLTIPDIQPVHQVHMKINLLAADQTKFKEEAYLTINAVPESKMPNTKDLAKIHRKISDRLKEEEAARKKDRANRKKRNSGKE